jgi:hypothetical protein
MSMGENNRIDDLRVYGKFIPIAQTQFLKALKQSAINQDSRAYGFQQKTAAGNGSSSTQELQHRSRLNICAHG